MIAFTGMVCMTPFRCQGNSSCFRKRFGGLGLDGGDDGIGDFLVDVVSGVFGSLFHGISPFGSKRPRLSRSSVGCRLRARSWPRHPVRFICRDVKTGGELFFDPRGITGYGREGEKMDWNPVAWARFVAVGCHLEEDR